MMEALFQRALEQGPLCLALVVAAYVLGRALYTITSQFVGFLQKGQAELIEELRTERAANLASHKDHTEQVVVIFEGRINDLRATTNRHEIHIKECNDERVLLNREVNFLQGERVKMEQKIAEIVESK